MIFELNLIPESAKERLRLEKLWRTLRSLLLIAALGILLAGIIILTARLILQHQFNRIVNETTLVTGGRHALEDSIRSLNVDLSKANKMLTSAFDWPNFINDFVALLPDGVTITSMTFVIADESAVSGTARTRDDLLQFKRALEDSALVEKVDLPITDLLARDNPVFTMRFTIRHAAPKR